jgi:hypothetical protein
MRRREFILALGGAAASWPFAARAQQSDKVRRIGVLMSAVEGDPTHPGGQHQGGLTRRSRSIFHNVRSANGGDDRCWHRAADSECPLFGR